MTRFALTPKLLATASVALMAAAASAQPMVTARVVSSAPVWEAVPVQGCAPGAYRAPSGVGAVLGAVIGGVIGNSFGGGDGRALATAAGVLGGAALGNTAEAQQGYGGGCATRYENRVTAYDVSYEIGGRHYQTRMAGDPGGWVQVPAPDNVYGAYNESQVQSYPVAPQPPAGAYPLPNGYPSYPGANRLPPGAVVTAPAYPQPYPPQYQQTYPVAPPQVIYVPAPAPVYVPAPVYSTPVGVSLSVGRGWGGHRHWGSHVGFGIGF
ncbi:glycine zipper 2TM domain-containing protein [Ottowia thiooxydans]|uniref:glycine zipper 2TM domain-containing protein n=1 Tax=Ottowia thiooxydans TaxID=219182 RepID=UPI0004119C13|nr:glycine zipper 2TM domain-containing protein [Ottowia thiooxydans]